MKRRIPGKNGEGTPRTLPRPPALPQSSELAVRGGGNSTKATSGINGAGTKTQKAKGIPDNADIFTQEPEKARSSSAPFTVSFLGKSWYPYSKLSTGPSAERHAAATVERLLQAQIGLGPVASPF